MVVRAARDPAAAAAAGVVVLVRGVAVVGLQLVDARRRVVGPGCTVRRGRLRRGGASRRACGGLVVRRRRGRRARFPDR